MVAVLLGRSAQMCSNSDICPPSTNLAHMKTRRAVRRPLACRTQAAQDAMCKDKVNSKKAPVQVEGNATVSFLGAGGQEITIECPKDTYILEAGLNNDVELPYTCRGGICGACVGRVVQGEVDQSDIDDLSFVLDDEEVAKGMALLCMSRPVSENVCIETQSDWGYSLGVGGWKGATGHIAGKEPEPLTPWGTQ